MYTTKLQDLCALGTLAAPACLQPSTMPAAHCPVCRTLARDLRGELPGTMMSTQRKVEQKMFSSVAPAEPYKPRSIANEVALQERLET